MKVAVPLSGGVLSAHFGRCEAYAFVDVDPESHAVLSETVLDSPPHEPGVLPAWIAEQGADVVITGGVGRRAIQLFAQHGVEVVTGAPQVSASELASAYARGELSTSGNVCDHDARPQRGRGFRPD